MKLQLLKNMKKPLGANMKTLNDGAGSLGQVHEDVNEDDEVGEGQSNEYESNDEEDGEAEHQGHIPQQDYEEANDQIQKKHNDQGPCQNFKTEDLQIQADHDTQSRDAIFLDQTSSKTSKTSKFSTNGSTQTAQLQQEFRIRKDSAAK